MSRPLADRMRPSSLEDYFGQRDLVGADSPLAKVINSNKLHSMILWGPPGVGKTTLARIIANETQRSFHQLSAVDSGVKDVRNAISLARKQHFFNKPGPIVFIDEIHRFNKAQQDSLLGAVEEGTIVLIGATTENPSFEVIPALLSRCQVYVLQSLNEEEMKLLIANALAKDEKLKEMNFVVKEHEALIVYAGGDGRRMLNVLDIVTEELEEGGEITNKLVDTRIKSNFRRYDKSGEQHYDMASAFIKSIRGSEVNASLYWLARMLDGGEDVKFIARRLVISASEDIGLANVNALLMANSAFQAVNMIGMPEARIILSQATIYLAGSPKSNSAYAAIDKALQIVKETGSLPVPLHLRNAPTDLMKNLNYGTGYKYAHDFDKNFVDQDYLPPEVSHNVYYQAGNNASENKMNNHLKDIQKDNA